MSFRTTPRSAGALLSTGFCVVGTLCLLSSPALADEPATANPAVLPVIDLQLKEATSLFERATVSATPSAVIAWIDATKTKREALEDALKKVRVDLLPKSAAEPGVK